MQTSSIACLIGVNGTKEGVATRRRNNPTQGTAACNNMDAPVHARVNSVFLAQICSTTRYTTRSPTKTLQLLDVTHLERKSLTPKIQQKGIAISSNRIPSPNQD